MLVNARGVFYSSFGPPVLRKRQYITHGLLPGRVLISFFSLKHPLLRSRQAQKGFMINAALKYINCAKIILARN
jgi:hypothetical protein